MSKQKPFFPPALYPHLYQGQPDSLVQQLQSPPIQEVVMHQGYDSPALPCGPGHLWCMLCNQVLNQGDKCLEILVGKVGRGTKSGQAMVIPDEQLEEAHPGTNNPVLCWDCGIPWMDEEFYGGEYFQWWMDSQEPYSPIDDEEEEDPRHRRR